MVIVAMGIIRVDNNGTTIIDLNANCVAGLDTLQLGVINVLIRTFHGVNGQSYGQYNGHLNQNSSQQYNGQFSGNQNCPMQAMIVTSNLNVDSNWYPESGASNHITNDLAHLSVSSPCSADSKVLVGNGSGLSVQHIGSSKLVAPNNNSFLLNNLLHVPSITKNLISVSQFTRDNNVYF